MESKNNRDVDPVLFLFMYVGIAVGAVALAEMALLAWTR